MSYINTISTAKAAAKFNGMFLNNVVHKYKTLN